MLAVVGGAAQLEFRDSESEVWRTRLQASSAQLQRAAGAVGRINVAGRPGVPYVGTGWLVEKDAIATNRHVAREFGQRRARRFHVQEGTAAQRRRACRSTSSKKLGGREQLSFPIVEILHIEDDDGPDFALLRVGESRGQALAPPIPLSMSPPQATQQVAVIGYPARDSRAPDEQLVQSIFGDVFDKKRLAPGQLTEAKAGRPAPRLFDTWRELGFGRARSGRPDTPSDCTSRAAFSRPTTPSRRRSLLNASNECGIRSPASRRPARPTVPSHLRPS